MRLKVGGKTKHTNKTHVYTSFFFRRRETLTRQADWRGIALSATGDIMVAVISGDRIWRSLNRGVSWEEALAPKDIYWTVATSASGSIMVAVSGEPDDHVIGRIYRSVDTGEEDERGGVEFWLGPIAPFPHLRPSYSAGHTWQLTSAPQIVWSGVASSADGSFWAATTWKDGVYLSFDAGATWAKSSAPDLAFKGISMSADGTKLAVCQDGGPVWVSSTSGSSWQPTYMTYNQDFRYEDIAMSASGSQLATVYYGSKGYVWLSSTGGSSWVTPGGPYNRYGRGITSSADGTKMAVATNGFSVIGTLTKERISISSDQGLTWRESNAPLARWESITSSSDMSKLAVVGDAGANTRITLSTDYGLTFFESGSRYTSWSGVASSANGLYLAACVYGDRIWTSPNGCVRVASRAQGRRPPWSWQGAGEERRVAVFR